MSNQAEPECVLADFAAPQQSKTKRRAAVIELQNVGFRYPRPQRYRDLLRRPFHPAEYTIALKHISMSIHGGERVALLGANGAGKTTLLKLVGGLLLPTEGSVWVSGVNTAHPRARSSMSVGYVINEERSFYWRMTGRHNLHFFAALEGLGGEELRSRVNLLIDLTDLGQHADKRVSDYSAGLRQRLAMARGLLTDPDILLLDEPTKSLDINAAHAIRELLTTKLQSSKPRTLVLTTNQPSDAVNVCGRVKIISAQRICCDRSLVGMTEREVVQMYRDSVPMDQPHA